MKSNIEIKDFFYALLHDSALKQAVATNGGELYRDQRPTNSGKEDIVIAVLDGLSGQIQTAVIEVNVYVPDVSRGDDKIEDTLRLRTLARMAIEQLENFNDGEYCFNIEKQTCFKVDGVDEHCINTQINLVITNF